MGEKPLISGQLWELHDDAGVESTIRTGKATRRQDPGVQNKGHGACEWHPERIEDWPHYTKSACGFVSWVVRVPGGSVGQTDHNTRYHKITLMTQSTSSMGETQRKHRADRVIQASFPHSQNNLNSDSLSDSQLLAGG